MSTEEVLSAHGVLTQHTLSILLSPRSAMAEFSRCDRACGLQNLKYRLAGLVVGRKMPPPKMSLSLTPNR